MTSKESPSTFAYHICGRQVVIIKNLPIFYFCLILVWNKI